MHVVHLPDLPSLRATLLAALAALLVFAVLVLAAEPLGSGSTSSGEATAPLPRLTPAPAVSETQPPLAPRPVWLDAPLTPPALTLAGGR